MRSLTFTQSFLQCYIIHKQYTPYHAGLLWLHVVITCPPPPHVPPEMQPSVNSTHPDVTHRVVG
ncbi:hypothetical protein GBAR_LOCUS22615, partial [Geodia barretti]